MVDLPTIPRRLETTQAPKSLVSAADVAKPYADLADGLNKAGAALGSVGEVVAENEAHKAVTRDAEGNLTVSLMPDFFGRAGRTYNRIAKQSYFAQLDPEIQKKVTENRLKFDGKPDEFATWGGEYVEALVGKQEDPELANAIRQRATQIVEQTHRGMLVQRHNRDLTRANEAVDAKLLTLADDAEKLARDGAPEEVLAATLQEFNKLLDEKVNNPHIAYPREKADRYKDEVLMRAHGGAILEGVERVYSLPLEQGGGYQAARAHLLGAVKEIGGTIKDAGKIQRLGDAWLNAQEKGLIGARDQVSKDWTAARPQMATLPRDALDDLEQRAIEAGAWRVATDIRQRRSGLEIATEIKRLPKSEQVRIAATGILPAPLRMGGTPVQIARQFEGLHEQSDRGAIAKFIEKSAGLKLDPAQTAWCAAFINGVMGASGRGGTGSLAAKSFLNYGTPTDAPTEGDIVVLPRGDPAGPYGHVGLYVGSVQRDGKNYVKILAGNQGNTVSTKEYPADQVLGYRRPPAAGSAPPPVATASGAGPAPEAAAPTEQGAAPPARVGFNLTQDRAGLLALDSVKDSLRKDLTERIRDFTTADRKLELPSIDEITALGEEVAFLGTPEQRQEVAELAAQAEYGAGFRELSAPKRAEAIAAWDARLQEGGTKFERELKAKLDAADAAITKEFKSDPYGAQYQFGVGTRPLPAINFTDPGQMQAVLAEKVQQQGAIRAGQDLGVFSAFRPDEAESFRNFLSYATSEQVTAAFSALRSLDDEVLFATLSDDKVKDGLRGAMRSTDPGKYTAVMSGIEAIYPRDPAQTTKLIGEDGWHALKTWQSNLRYMDAKTLADERKRAEDPQAAERRKINTSKGEELARKVTPEKVVEAFDDSYIFSGPKTPVDPETRDAMMGDYETLSGRRFAETLNADTAHEQTIEHMKTKWRRSPVNGDRLMLRAPETVYPAIEGSHDWLKVQIEAALTEKFGAREITDFILTDEEIKGAPLKKLASWEYALRADRRTETEAQRYDKTKPASETNRAPGYIVLVRDNKKSRPEWDVVTSEQGAEMRFRFDPAAPKAEADARFGARRERALEVGRQGSMIGAP